MNKRRIFTVGLLIVSACDGPAGGGGSETETETEGATSSTEPGATSEAGTSAGPTESTSTGSEGEVSSDDSERDDTGESSESSSSGETCGSSCGTGDPEVVWVAEPEHDLGGGSCVDVLGDGEGGAIASFITNPESPLWGGLVVALDDGGAVGAEAQLEQRRVTGLERVGAGAFSWVDSYANVGESSTALDDLEGDWLAKDLLSLDDLAPVTGGTAYTAVVNAFFPECRIRLSIGGTVDSPPLPCGDIDDRWRLRPTQDGGVVAGLLGRSALVRVASNGDTPAYLESRFQRTMLDFAVDDEDRVWTVGIIRNPNEAGPSFGSFVARHDPSLGEDPQWEVLEEGDASYAWTTIAMSQGEPIVVGRDADAVPRVVALSSSGDEKWSLELDLPPSVLLRRADLDAQGRLFLCGDRATGEGPLAASSPVVVRIDLS